MHARHRRLESPIECRVPVNSTDRWKKLVGKKRIQCNVNAIAGGKQDMIDSTFACVVQR